MSGTYYRPGENRSCCPVCGKEYRASEFRKRWDGLWVCPKDYEQRHPQDFLRVRPDDMRPAVVAGCCGSDGYPQISTSDAPLCPFPLEPLDNALLSSSTTASLSWSTFPGVASYQIYLWADGDTQPTSATYTTTTSPYFVTGLNQDTGYNWFVTAVGDDGEIRDCSGNARFFTTALPLLACPELVSPSNEFSFEGDSITLDWNAVSGASSYNVYLFPENDPRALVTNTASTSYEATGLNQGVTYFWTVTAVNASGESSACGLRTFSTENTVLLSASSYTAYDSESYATIVVLRNGDVGEVTADYATADDTAVAPGNYTDTSGTVSWPNGDIESKPVQIPIEPLATVTERESDVLYPWINDTDPRDSRNGFQYKYIKQAVNTDSSPATSWRNTLDEALSDFAADTGFSATLPTVLMGWSYLSTSNQYSWEMRPYGGALDQDREILNLHYNDFQPSAGFFQELTAGGTDDTAKDCRAVNTKVSVGSGTVWWGDRTEYDTVEGDGGGMIGIYYRTSTITGPGDSVSPRSRSNNNCPSAGGGQLRCIPDVIIQCRRVPGAPELPGSDLPDWPIDPDNFWWDSGTGDIYSKTPWSLTAGSFRWISLLSVSGTPSLVQTRPLSPVRVQGAADDTEANWNADYVAAQVAGDMEAGLTYDSAGTGGATTYPRNQTYAWVRSYKLPLQFTVNLSNPVGAALIAPDSATVYILPA